MSLEAQAQERGQFRAEVEVVESRVEQGLRDDCLDETVVSDHKFRWLFPEMSLAGRLLGAGARESLDDGERVGGDLCTRLSWKTRCSSEQILNSNGDRFEEVVELTVERDELEIESYCFCD